MSIVREWNTFDILIMKIERLIHSFNFADMSDQVDVETMIAAETEHLQKENENLKARETPLYMLEEDAKYMCPKCQMPLQENDRYCSNCGHRVMKHISFGDLGTDDE